jgi:glucose-6-phosphate 1-dehydrogenase
MASGRPKPKGQEADFFGCDYRHDALSILVVGASGDLAAKKTYPALLSLFRDGYLPEHVVIVGYARSRKTDDEFRAHVSSKLSPGGVSDPAISRFLQRCFYRAGPYGDEERLAEVYEDVAKLEADARPDAGTVNRMFYFAVPPSVFAAMGRALKAVAESPRGWNRYLIEKPFGSDLESFEKLHEELSSVLPEASVYRLDHYLGKQMIKTMLLLRFGNAIFEPLWNRNHIASITFSFKENFGTAGRGGFYDDIGVIRDVVQNHVTQMVALVAMEAPVRASGESIRDEKRKVLDCIPPLKPQDCIIGQYTADDEGRTPAYTDDDGVPDTSRTATFASCVLRVQNPRWDGVPFILRAGKALNETKAEIRVQFRRPPGSSMLFPRVDGEAGEVAEETVGRNELVIRLQPDQAMYVKVNVQAPGLRGDPIISELDLSYKSRYPEAFVRLPDAYTFLILQALRGDNSSFMRADELRSAWRIFTPLLRAIDAGELPLHMYKAHSRGPPEYDAMAQGAGYLVNSDYSWQPPAKL